MGWRMGTDVSLFLCLWKLVTILFTKYSFAFFVHNNSYLIAASDRFLKASAIMPLAPAASLSGLPCSHRLTHVCAT
jgi:hypothetical protein